MNALNKYMVSSFLPMMLVSLFGLALFPLAITWWHGYAFYFVLLGLLICIISVSLMLYNNTLYMLLGGMLFLYGFIFNLYGLIVLFFPKLKGWGDWQRCNTHGCWPDVHFQLPADFNYATLLVFLGILFIYGGKKFFELDMDAMKKAAYKRKEIVRDHVYYLNTAHSKPGASFDIIFKPRFLIKSESWLHAAALGFCVYVILPFGGAAGGVGSSMAGNGNNPFLAGAYFVCGYFFLCACTYALIGVYAQYRLIKELEKEMGVKLKPAVYQQE